MWIICDVICTAIEVIFMSMRAMSYAFSTFDIANIEGTQIHTVVSHIYAPPSRITPPPPPPPTHTHTHTLPPRGRLIPQLKY